MNRKIFLSLTLFAICYWFLFDFLRWAEFDTAGYIGGARLLFDLPGGINTQSRISKPLVLILPGLSELLFGIHPRYIFLLQNLTCFYLCGFLMYRILFQVSGDNKLSFLGMCAYIMCQPFAVYSLFVQVDVVGWFFELLVIFLVIKYVFKSRQIEIKKIILTSLICSAGCLVKESSIIGFMFLIISLLIIPYPLTEKLKIISICLFCFLIPLIPVQYFIDQHFHVSLVKRVIEEQKAEGFVYYNKRNFQQVYRMMDLFWFLLIIGLIKFKLMIKTYKAGYLLKALIISTLLAFILVPVYPFIVDRILFMIVPFLIPFVVFGASFFKRSAAFLVFLGGILNILFTYSIYRWQVHGLLAMAAILFSFVLILTYHFTKNSQLS